MSDLHPARHRRSCNEPGHAHELTFTCYRRFRFLSAERPCRWLGDAIHEARRSLDFAFWAFVFMPEHAHLIVCPRRPAYEMATILKAIKEPVGRQGVSYIAEHAPPGFPGSRDNEAGGPNACSGNQVADSIGTSGNPGP